MKAPDSKSGRRATFSWVQIPLSPPELIKEEKMRKLFLVVLLFCLLISCAPKKTVTLYFSKATQTDFYLIPVKRTVGSGDIYTLALEELIKGPKNKEEGNAVLPKTTKVLGVEKNGDILTVNFSKEIIFDANSVGVSSSTEALALASIANTLTEFSEIKGVKILIEGRDSGEIDGRMIEDFWGHIGIRDILTRNDSLLSPH